MYIPQYQLNNVISLIEPQKAVVLYGPRRCGKTTLLNHMVKKLQGNYLMVSGEDVTIQQYLSSGSVEKLRSFVGDRKVLIIDEAQKTPRIGLNIKLLLDHVPGLAVVASGSSSFDLARQTGEPLTGRKFTVKLFPLAQLELNAVQSRPQTDALLEQRLIYGSYPEVVLCPEDQRKTLYLRELVNSYLFKDILELNGLRHSDKLVRLLQCVALQLGSNVSLTELGTQLSMSKNTVERYLGLLEKTFILFRLGGFSRSLRKEIGKTSRWFFYDVGVRNALINNFNGLTMRDDVGMLWENYIIAEMLKKQEYLQQPTNNYFWRTYDRKEIDLVCERAGRLCGYEMKISPKRRKVPTEWLKTYAGAEYHVITRDNYLDYIT
jgi:predicted AAA+ superfamily ATPase